MAFSFMHPLEKLARLLMRGPDVPFILADLEEAYQRDLERGCSDFAAGRRYAANVLGSILHSWRSHRWLAGWRAWRIDLKLAARMLVKQPALTLVAVFALSIGIPVGLLPFHVIDSLSLPMPVPEGDEIVMLRNWNLVESREVTRPIHDFVRWRRELRSFEAIGLARSDPYNVSSEESRAAPIRGAEVTASVFSILQVQPLLGRTLDPSDEVAGAPDVVVVGYDLWRTRLAGDPGALGRTIRIGKVPHTVVGVMPEGFLFPFRDHLWLPLRANPLHYEFGAGPDGWVMGRLADGVTMDEARLEMELLGQRLAADSPETHANLQPQLLPYSVGMMGTDIDGNQEVIIIQFLALLLLILACGNVGILILARTSGRTREIAIRTALGASRARVVGQLFVESVLLAVLAAGVGLLIGQSVASAMNEVNTFLPFWMDFDVRLQTVLLALSLAAFSALFAGIIPGLKATGRNIQVVVQKATGGRSGIRFGAVSSLLIVAEVAVAVWFLTLGSAMLPAALAKPSGLGIETDQYLTALLRIPWVDPSASTSAAYQEEFQNRIRVAHEELKRRIAADPQTGKAAIANVLPGMAHPTRYIEIQGKQPPSGSPGIQVHVAQVDLDYFDALEQPILEGRGFRPSDLRKTDRPVIVNSSFVNQVLQGRNPLGLRLRYTSDADATPGSWQEIVGVVGPLGMNQLNPAQDAGVYQLAEPGHLHPVRFALRVGPEPESWTTHLRAISWQIDPAAMIQQPGALDEVFNPDNFLATWLTVLVGLLALIAVILSASGLFALMSFTVNERTHEIGIRTALGGQPVQIVSAIARRACGQLISGVVLGLGLCWLTLPSLEDDLILRAANWPLIALGIAVAVILVGLAACTPPTRRGLKIEPVQALRGDT